MEISPASSPRPVNANIPELTEPMSSSPSLIPEPPATGLLDTVVPDTLISPPVTHEAVVEECGVSQLSESVLSEPPPEQVVGALSDLDTSAEDHRAHSPPYVGGTPSALLASFTTVSSEEVQDIASPGTPFFVAMDSDDQTEHIGPSEAALHPEPEVADQEPIVSKVPLPLDPENLEEEQPLSFYINEAFREDDEASLGPESGPFESSIMEVFDQLMQSPVGPSSAVDHGLQLQAQLSLLPDDEAKGEGANVIVLSF